MLYYNTIIVIKVSHKNVSTDYFHSSKSGQDDN